MFRKSILPLFVLLISVFAVPAHAQNPDLFESQQEQQAPTDLEELLAEVPEGQTYDEQPTTIEEFANQYYGNCLRQDHPKVDEQALEILCACTAAKMPDEMDLRQAMLMQTNTSSGQLQRLRFMEFIYSPCLKFPVADMVERRCLDDKAKMDPIRRDNAVCRCTGEAMGQYMESKAPGYVNLAVRRNLSNVDPLKLLYDSKQFNNIYERKFLYCRDVHEYGKK